MRVMIWFGPYTLLLVLFGVRGDVIIVVDGTNTLRVCVCVCSAVQGNAGIE